MSDLRTDQKVMAEAFNRHEVQNAAAFSALEKGLEHAHDCTHEMGEASQKRDKEASVQAEKDFHEIRKDIDELKKFMWKAMGVIGVISTAPALIAVFNFLKSL